MDNIAIENFAISAVKDSILMSEYLNPYISDNDKEPSWDGHIYIYDKKGKKKENLIGRVPVQVKGALKDDFSRDKISYPMEVVDLRNYLRDGGAILFVVYINSSDESIHRKIYYSELTPINLRMLIPSDIKQKSKFVELKEFPRDNKRKSDIFLNFYENSKRQSSFSEANLYSIETLRQNNMLEGLSLFVSTFGDNPENALFDTDIYLYARVKGSAIPQPLEVKIGKIEKVKPRKESIIVGGKQLYSEYKAIEARDNVSIQIGSSLTMTFPRNGESLTMRYTEAKTLRALTKDLEFILLYMDIGKFYIGDACFSFDYEHVDQSNFDIEKQKARLEYLKKVVEVLDLLGYHEDLDLSKLTPEDDSNLRFLVTALVEKKHLKNLGFKTPRVVKMKVEDASFALYIRPCEASQEYEVYDFFKTELQVAYDSDGKERLPISQYFLLSADDICSLTNLRAEVFLPSFQKQPRHKDTMNRVNLFLLELLKAYDMSAQKRQDLLDSAILFAEWIQTADDSELDKRIRRLNYLQATKRKGTLNDIEKEELYSMTEDESCPEDCKTAAYLLLDAQQTAQRHFDRMSEQEQKAFRDFPIYHFWKESQEDKGVQ